MVFRAVLIISGLPSPPFLRADLDDLDSWLCYPVLLSHQRKYKYPTP